MNRPLILPLAALLLAAAAPLPADDSWLLYDDSQVARIEIETAPETLEYLYEHVESDSMHLASIRFVNAFVDETVEDVGLRLRGATSRVSAKKSFKLSFNDFVPGREFLDVDKLNLNGEHNDPTISRSKLCWDLFGRAGLHASRAAHAEVWINGSCFGLHVSVEHVDDEFLWKRFADDSGNLWKCLWPADLQWRGPGGDDYKQESGGHRVYELKTNEDADDYSALARLVRVLHETPDAAIEDSLEGCFDVADALEAFAIDVLVGGWDDYRYLSNNFYLYHEPAEDLVHYVPYDYDNTFGVDWFGVDWSVRDPYAWGQDGRPLAERLLERPRWRALYTHLLEHYALRLADRSLWEERLDSLRLRARDAALRDSFRTLDYGFDMDDYDDGFGLAHYENQHVRRGIREFADRRVPSVLDQLETIDAGPSIYRAAVAPVRPWSTDSLLVEAALFAPAGLETAVARWRGVEGGVWHETPLAFAGDPLSPRAETADRWTAALPPPGDVDWVEVELLAADGAGRLRRWPATGPKRLPVARTGALRLNELLARNDSQGQDPAGDFDDWAEILNFGDGTVPLAGHYLSDDPDNLVRWRFPDEAPALGPGERLLVWCDDEPEQEGLHASFALSGDGEFLALTSPDGATVLDSTSFGPQETDVSWGRLPDGSGGWVPLAPTPGLPNDDALAERAPARPAGLELSAAPNPFNGRCVFTLQDASGGPCRLRVHDLLGRLVWTAELRLEAGQALRASWDGRVSSGGEAASGRYWLSAETAQGRRALPLTLLR